MNPFGSCADCDESGRLRYKPDMALDGQSRPSVCEDCRTRRETRMVEQFREERPDPPRVSSVPEVRDDGE